VARHRTLDAASIAALLAALCTVQVWWLRLGEQALAHPGAVPDSRRAAWTENTRQERDASAVFNTAAAAHNAAVLQFPASLLARLVGFREAGSL
jgi:LemA protein